MSKQSPIKDLLIGALLYLPLCFVVWFYAAGLMVLPANMLANWAFELWQPDMFNGIEQHRFMLHVQTLITPRSVAVAPGQIAVVEVVVNPMKYGYGLAVIGGLVLAVPGLSKGQRVLQLVFGFLLISMIQANGVVWETLKSLLFSGGDVFAAINATGISHNLVASMYQMSYLIIPAVLPVIFWVVMNRQFIGVITQYNKEGDSN